MCFYSPINIQVIFCNGNGRHFYDRAFEILQSHHMKYFILNADDYVHDRYNNNSPKSKLNNIYGNARIKWRRKHGNLEFTPDHINYFIVEIWEDLKISSDSITHDDFKNTNILPLYSLPPKISLQLIKLPKFRKRMV